MKRFFHTLIALSLLATGSVWAASVELSRGQGLPGDLVTLILEIDTVPDEALALEIDLKFDPAKVQYVPKSSRKLELFRDDVAGSPVQFSEVSESPGSNKVYFQLLASYSRLPTATRLISVDFRIADQSNGDIPIELELINPSFNTQIDSVTNGLIAVTAVPLPPAALLFGAPFVWLIARRKQRL